jgi:hypothetical protein
MQLTAGTEEFYLRFAPSTEVDVVTGGGYEVFAVPAGDLVNGDFIPASSNRKYKGPDTSITVPAAAGIWGVKAAAYDVFGDSGLNYTPLMTCTVTGKVEDLLQALTGQLTSSQLNEDLNAAVGAIGPLAEEVEAINSTLTEPETGLIAQVTSLQSVVSDPETGLITKLDGLQSQVTDPETGLITRLTNLSTIVEDPTTGLVTQVAANQASFGDNLAALSVEQQVRASSIAPNWSTGTYNAGRVVIYTTGTPAVPYMFQSLTDGNNTVPSVVAGVATATAKWKPVSANLYAQMMLKTDVNGHITGIGIANDGVTGVVEILADKFAIVDPSDSTTSIVPFIVSGGVVIIDTALISKLSADKISTGVLQALNTISVGGIVIDAGDASSTGCIRLGKSSSSSDGAGFWLGNDSGTPKFNIGNGTKYLKWTGDKLDYTGTIRGDRILRGSISRAGSVSAGDGFTTTLSDGIYSIVFTDAFSNTPSILVTSTSDRANGVHVFTKSVLGASVILTLDGVAATSNFDFVAIGPP